MAPDDVVRDSLAGVVHAGGGRVVFDKDHRVVLSATAGQRGRVGVVSGGGAGHEPLHAGFVGPGMLDAAAVGEIFTSPNPEQILAAISATDGGAGVVLIVKNYVGDVMNFEMAAELAATEGHEVSLVIIADDLAGRNFLAPDQRRGLGGTILVEKVAGAMARDGAGLEEVARAARHAAAVCVSHGMAVTGPSTGDNGPSFTTKDDEFELGVGIHGEPGTELCRIAQTNPVEKLLFPMVEALPAADAYLLITSGLGGTPLIEVSHFHAKAMDFLAKRNINVVRHLVGELITCLDADGVTCTLAGLDEHLLDAWDAEVDTAVLSW